MGFVASVTAWIGQIQRSYFFTLGLYSLGKKPISSQVATGVCQIKSKNDRSGQCPDWRLENFWRGSIQTQNGSFLEQIDLLLKGLNLTDSAGKYEVAGLLPGGPEKRIPFFLSWNRRVLRLHWSKDSEKAFLHCVLPWGLRTFLLSPRAIEGRIPRAPQETDISARGEFFTNFGQSSSSRFFRKNSFLEHFIPFFPFSKTNI